jgi:hypothetical protein
LDGVKAKEWEAKLRGQSIEGWVVQSLIDHGKSAAVFKATGPSGHAALKIFDDDLIQRYGDKVQLERIHRELDLIGKHHPNMVSILGGGFHEESKNHYIVMEYLDGLSLSKCLVTVPETNVPSLVEQLVSACEFLEASKLAHRDIKPANIVVLDDFSRLVLLDFGVLKPVGEVGLTDVNEQRLFVGTLQYSSPEFLLRDEDDTEQGWRALAIYQVGAILHDLIMRRPIFAEFVNPYAALVNAVQHEQPTVASETVPSYLVDACRMALVKDPAKRLSLVDWDAFRPPVATSVADAARQRIGKRLLLAEALTEGAVDSGPATLELLETVIEGLKVELRRIRQANATIMPPLEITRGVKKAPTVLVKMSASAEFKLGDELRFEMLVCVIDVESQAVQLSARAVFGAGGSNGAQHTTIFRGPYSSGAIGDRIEAALIVALDQAQVGTSGSLSLADVGVE